MPQENPCEDKESKTCATPACRSINWILLIILAILIIALYFWQSSRQTNESTLNQNQNSDQSAEEQTIKTLGEINSKTASEETESVEAQGKSTEEKKEDDEDTASSSGELKTGWQDYQNEEYGFSLQIPPGVVTSTKDDIIYITPETEPANPSPIPYMRVEVLDKGLPDAVADYSMNGVEIASIEKIEVNGLRGRQMILSYNAGGAAGLVPEYLLTDEEKTYRFSLWEGLGWKLFDEVALSFKKTD